MTPHQSGTTARALLDTGLVTPEQLAEAERTAELGSSNALEVLVAEGTVHRDDLVRTAAESVGLSYVDLTEYSVSASAAA
jgi:hypothetical protein